MARNRSNSTPDPEATTRPDTLAPTPAPPEAPPQDVLVMVNRGGAIEAVWNGSPARREGTEALIPQQFRHRFEPGLSFCPGRLWPKAKQTPSFVRGVEDGDMEAVAGHQGDLGKSIAAIKGGRLAALVLASHHVASLRRLQELEEQGAARKAVLDAIEERMSKLEAQVRREEQDHAERRRATHARAARRRRRGS